MVKKRIKNKIESFKKLLKKESLNYHSMILFGSCTGDLSNDQSDIDICLLVAEDIAVKEYQMKINGLAGRHGYNFDIIVATRNNFKTNFVSPILHQIRTCGVKV